MRPVALAAVATMVLKTMANGPVPLRIELAINIIGDCVVGGLWHGLLLEVAMISSPGTHSCFSRQWTTR
jgi:hypothetical protein